VAVPAATATDAADFKGEMWRIDLAGDVDGRQGIQRLLCERLSLYNKSSKQPAEPGTKDTTTPGKGGARTKAAAPKGDGPARNQEGAAAASARFLQPDAPPPLVIMADGPLIVTPVGVTEQAALGDARFEVAATGAPAVVDDGQTHIVGAEVHYNTKTGSGSVLGKEAPMLLEQPGRLHLTGGRLDFDRVRNTAEVMGGGQLHAQVQSASFGATGKSKRGAAAGQPAAPPAGQVPPAPPELSTLDATWTKGMRMEFYRLPANLEGGATEIKQAIFHGQSVVKQRDGILKGDELVIDFFAPEQGRGQAVERLRGHGDVYIKNEPVEAKPPAPGEAPPPVPPPAPDAAPGASTGANKMAVGDIKCQNIDMLFARDAAGDAQAKNLKASGAVLINDPQGKIKAEDLTIAFAPSAKGGGLDAQFLEATGNVLIDREDLHAEGDHVHRDLTTGMLQLEGKPARAARGQSRVVGPYIEFNQNEGRAIVRGAGELEMPTTTDLRGRQRAQPEPMIVTWRNGMLFEDHRNFAEFDGAASAATGTTRLNGDRLWVYFADQATDATKVGALGVPAAASAKAAPAKAVPAGATKTASAKDKSKGSGGDMQDLFGHKQLVRVLAENNVRAIEQQLDPDKTLRFQLEMFGDNLTYLAENRKAYIRGPGLLRTCSRERGKAGESQGAGIEPPPGDTLWKNPLPDGYSRTDVAWTESMAFDGAGNRAYFKGKVDALNIGRGAPGDAAAARRRASEMRIRSGDMQVVFTEKQPLPADGAAAATMLPATAATAPAPAVKAPATPATAAPQEASREERMTVEKLVADGNVQLWIDDRRGIAERLIYQRDPQLIRLYRGTDDWARLWQENEASQEFGEIVARVITYEPGTGRVEVVDQQAITIAPKAKPEVKSKAGAPGPAKPLK
jgi:lipopolysaccharide export system protein LptA